MFHIITKPDCPWCDKAKELLNEKGIGFTAYLYNDHPMIVKLMFTSGLKTVPQIWHNSTHIGGYEDLEDWLLYNDPQA
jgi:glutaredoxin